MGMEKPRRTKALKNNLGEGDRFTAKPAPEPGCSALDFLPAVKRLT
jgi:hypothetical protein